MIKKVLIINPFGIGDAIFSMALAQALKKTLPQVTVGFLGNERTIVLLRMNAHIDICHEFDRDALRAERTKGLPAYLGRAWRYVEEIRKERYDAALDLSLGREFSFAAMLAGIPKRIGFDYKGRGFFLTHRKSFSGYEAQLVADQQLTLLNFLGIQPPKVTSTLPFVIPPSADQTALRWLEAQGLAGKKYFAVAPGGGKSWGSNASYKQWSASRFGEAAERWAKKTGQNALFLGDPEESGLIREARTRVSARSAAACGLPIEVAAALLKRSEMLLCNDGGLLHLANALGTRTVSLYGPVDEKVYGPYGQDTRHAVLTQAVPCRPCYKEFHFPPCLHERRCLEEISVEKVLAGMEQIS